MFLLELSYNRITTFGGLWRDQSISCFRLCAFLKNKPFDFVGRKESVADLKKVITTLHKEMSMMQEKLYDFKEASSAVHSLRAELHSMHAILERKVSLFHIC